MPFALPSPADLPAAAAPLCAAAAAALAAAAEALHARRCRRVARLAFGPSGAPRAWTRAAAPLRTFAAGLAAWALVTLYAHDGGTRFVSGTSDRRRDLVVLLDVSPSMALQDAGPGASQTRGQRAAVLLSDLLRHLPPEAVRVSLAAFYTDARPLVLRCEDREVIRNFLDDMPLVYTFDHGKTDLLKALNATHGWVRDWAPRSATLVVLTDGDTVADTGLQPLPVAFGDALLAGVGDPLRGVFIDGHASRQDRTSLMQTARRIGARYVDANLADLPDDCWQRLAAAPAAETGPGWGRREWAIAALALAAAVLSLLPPALSRWGSAWAATSPAAARTEHPENAA